MKADYSPDNAVRTGIEGAWKRTGGTGGTGVGPVGSGLPQFVDGSGSEGTLWEIISGTAGTFKIGTCTFRITL